MMLIGTDDQAEIRDGDYVIPVRWFDNSSRAPSRYSPEQDEVFNIHVQSIRSKVELGAIGRNTNRPPLYYELTLSEKQKVESSFLRFESADSHQL